MSVDKEIDIIMADISLSIYFFLLHLSQLSEVINKWRMKGIEIEVNLIDCLIISIYLAVTTLSWNGSFKKMDLVG